MALQLVAQDLDLVLSNHQRSISLSILNIIMYVCTQDVRTMYCNRIIGWSPPLSLKSPSSLQYSTLLRLSFFCPTYAYTACCMVTATNLFAAFNTIKYIVQGVQSYYQNATWTDWMNHSYACGLQLLTSMLYCR